VEYTCHYINKENRWVMVADTFLAVPDSELKRIARAVKWEWMEKLKAMDGLKDTLKMNHIKKALQSLENNSLTQVRGVHG
jgi:hypothetical protein